MTTPTSRPDVNIRIIFICCIATVAIAFGIRQGFGLFMRPITLDMDWSREALAATFATQSLMIGLMAPLTGMLADRWSPGKVIMLGGVLFSAGIATMGYAQTPTQMWAGGGLLAGCGLSAVGLPLMLSVIGRIAPPDRRGLWLGIATSASTIGQIVLIPVSQHLIAQFDWRVAVLALAVLAAVTVPLAFVIARSTDAALSNRGDQTLHEVINEARSHRGYVLLLIGFFVCGFHVQFIAIHLPAYISDMGLGLGIAATALTIIAVGNAGGSWLSGCRAVGLSGCRAVGLAGRPLSQAQHPQRHLCRPRRAVRDFHRGADQRGQCVCVFSRAGLFVVEHGAADFEHRRAGVRPTLHGDLVRLRVHESPDGQLRRRVDRRLLV